MVHSDGNQLRVIPMKTSPESLPLGERLRPPKQSMLISRLLKRTVSPRGKLPQARCLPSVVMASVDE
jgi:hypothetical protein